MTVRDSITRTRARTPGVEDDPTSATVRDRALACKPLSRWVSGHRDPQQLSPSMAEHKKREQLLKGNRRNHKQINRRNPLHMIAKEGLPRLQWPIAPRHHVDRNRGLGDLDAELEQLAMDLGSAPQRVLKTHSSDEIAHLFADPRSAPERTGLPSPVGGKARSMQTHNGLGPDNRNGVVDAWTATIEPNEQNTNLPHHTHTTYQYII